LLGSFAESLSFLWTVDAIKADSFALAMVHDGYCVAVTDTDDLALPDSVSINMGVTKGENQCRDDKNPNWGGSFQGVLLAGVAVSKRHPVLAKELLRLIDFDATHHALHVMISLHFSE
jgi:hypothetical protein